MLRVGFIGWRGMVGSVLIKRMLINGDFRRIETVFFSTSNIGGVAPDFGQSQHTLLNAYDIKSLLHLDCIVTTQGSDYTNTIMPQLLSHGYSGFFIDASSALRMSSDTILVLDPLNHEQIVTGIRQGVKNYSGANCTVSLMLLALSGLFKHNLVQWVNSQTYQAASGAGANNMRELLRQCGVMHDSVLSELNDDSSDILSIDSKISQILKSKEMPIDHFGTALAGNVLPWIDVAMGNGQTKEEYKACVEANKILGFNSFNEVKIDGNCVRVGSMRSHSQALTIKLKSSDLKISDIEDIISSGNEWVRLIANNKKDTLNFLTPISVSGTLDIAIGRLRKLNFGEDYLSAFTVGDQLLWGAAEPIRRMINILVDNV